MLLRQLKNFKFVPREGSILAIRFASNTQHGNADRQVAIKESVDQQNAEFDIKEGLNKIFNEVKLVREEKGIEKELSKILGEISSSLKLLSQQHSMESSAKKSLMQKLEDVENIRIQHIRPLQIESKENRGGMFLEMTELSETRDLKVELKAWITLYRRKLDEVKDLLKERDEDEDEDYDEDD